MRRETGIATGVRRCMAVLLLGVIPGVLPAETLTAGPTDYEAALKRLGPGDRLRLEPGVYTDGLKLHGITGVPGSPTVIEGPPPGGEPAMFLAAPGRNTVSLSDVAYLVVRNLVLEGRGVPVDAVKAEGTSRFAHHVTLEGLTIRGHDANQQIVGISTKCPAWDWTIRGNRIERAGTGIYLGDSDGSDPFIGGVIEGNVIRGTTGYNLQIKHQRERPEREGIPTAPRRTIIRHNTFSKAGGGATGSMARPNLLVGDVPPAGPGEFDRYLVYGNFFYQNPTEALMQASGRVAVYRNLFVNTTDDGMALRLTPHKGQLRYSEVFHNTIVAEGRGIGIWGVDREGRHWIGANAVFAARPLDGEYSADWNVTGTPDEARAHLRAPGAAPPGLDLHPVASALGVPAIPAGALVNYPGAAVDFDGRPRPGGRAGAYNGPAEGSAWVPDPRAAPRAKAAAGE